MLRNFIGFGMSSIGVLFVRVRRVGAQMQFGAAAKARMITILPAAMATFVGSITEIVGIQRNAVIGATVFIDTFEDGDLTNNEPVSAIDGTPVIWRPFRSSEMDVQSRKLAAPPGTLEKSEMDGLGSCTEGPWGHPTLDATRFALPGTGKTSVLGCAEYPVSV